MNMEEKRELPIGVLDSGLGGISVLKEMVKLMPYEDFIYFGDSANAPYGTKPREEIKRLTFAVVEHLLNQGIKGLAVACNTATSAAVWQLRQVYPDLPLVGIEPAVKPAVVNNHGGRVIVMATPMTIQQQKFQNMLKLYEDQAEIVPVSCKGLMEFVEQDMLAGEILNAYFKEYLEPHLTPDTETIVLGCTHYPFLKPQLREYLGERRIELIDGSFGTARELKRRLNEKQWLHENPRERTIQFENSSEDRRMIDLCWKMLNMEI